MRFVWLIVREMSPKLHEEGVDLLDSNENGFLTDENGISFYDLSGNLQWSFNKYDVSSAWLYGKKCIC